MSPSIVIPSTGCCPADWRAWWREQSVVDGTDWPALHRRLQYTWRELRSLAEKIFATPAAVVESAKQAMEYNTNPQWF